MKKKNLRRIFPLIVFLILGSIHSYGQSFTIQIQKDTVLAGNYIQVSFTAENIDGNFEAPDMTNIPVVSGPNVSISSTFINGTGTSSATYTYTLLAEDIGEITIPPAYYISEEKSYETLPTSITILSNPEGIIEEHPSKSNFHFFGFPSQEKSIQKSDKQEKKRKKRKLKKL